MQTHKLFNQKNDGANTFAIVGMGLSGTSFFCQLIDNLIVNAPADRSFQIKIFEKNADYFATGDAYHVNLPAIWTLNNSAKNFKLTQDGNNVAEWMKENKHQWQDQYGEVDPDYVPRALVGLYLKDQYSKAKEKAKQHGICVKEYFSEIIDVSCLDKTHWLVETAQHKSYKINALICCLGHAPANKFAHLKSKPNYFHSTEIEKLKTIPPDARVYIIGGQSTFVDNALWLTYINQHVGKIYTVTRNQSTITTKGNKDACDELSLQKFTEELQTNHKPKSLSLTEGKLLFWNTYRNSTQHPVDLFNHPPRTKEALIYQLNKYDGVDEKNQNLGNIDELRSFVFTFYKNGCYKEFWNKLCDEDKEEFNHQISSRIFSYLTGITPLSARLLLELYNREQIEELSGLENIQYDDDHHQFVLNFKDGMKIDAEYLINASGLGYDARNANEKFPLLRNLIDKGFIVPRKLGGIEVNDYGQVIDKDNHIQNNLIFIGPMASFGHDFPTPYASFLAVSSAENALKALTPMYKKCEEENKSSIIYLG